MQSAVRAALTAGLAAVLAAAALAAPVTARAQAGRSAQVRITAEVAAGKHRAMRFGNVPARAQLAIAMRASSKILVQLLSEADARRFPAVADALFTAPVEGTFSFSVTVPAAGNYYVVLDNTRGETSSKVVLVVRASRGDAGDPKAAPQPAPPEPRQDSPSPLRRSPGTHDM